MSTIVIGVDDSARSEDAVAFARRLTGATRGRIVLANAFPYSDVPSRAANLTYRAALERQSRDIVQRMAGLLSGVPERVHTYSVANHSPAHALDGVAQQEHAALIVVGSTHTGRVGRVLPGSTAERLLHGSPCAVAIVPDGYRTLEKPRIRRIGVALNATDEGRAAVTAAAGAARALDAELEVIAVAPARTYVAPAYMPPPDYDTLRKEIEDHVRGDLESSVAELPSDVRGEAVLLTGDAADELTARSEGLDLLIMGSRRYGPLRAVLAGGVSGRVVRAAHCPVIVVPRGVDAPLGDLFGAATAATSP
jgi:nucleotide-binding universal stress UspA family protein